MIHHAQSRKHKDKVKWDTQAKSCQTLNFSVQQSSEQKTAEIKLSVFIAEHCSVKTVDHLSEMLPMLDRNSKVLSMLKIHRTKCAMLLKNVISPCMLKDIVEDVGDAHYSLIIDESTDVASDKILCCMLKYFSANRRKIVTTFYRLILVQKCDAESLFTAVTNQLAADNLVVKNLIGVGVDGASVMVGIHHSFATILKTVVPDVVIIKCVCHSLHLCAEYACKEIPSCLEFFIREICNYFSHSPKRKYEYTKLYSLLYDTNPKKIAKLAGTRWLSREKAVSTILEQWDELFNFFKIASRDDKCFTAQKIIDIMNCPAYKAYLVFIKSTLVVICKTNVLFQGENISPLILFQDLMLLLKGMLKKIVVPAQLQKISDSELVNFCFDNYVMSTSAIYFGYDFELIIKNMKQEEVHSVKERCKNFIVIFCKQLQKRLPNNISILESINIFSSATATSQQKQSIVKIANLFNRFSVDLCQEEWENISNKVWQETSNLEAFWCEVYNDVDSAGNKRYQNIATLALSLLSLPISNAVVERAFSVYNVIKNNLRNSLSIQVMQSIMMTRYFLKIDGLSCINFKPTESMLQKFNVNMYDHKTTDHSLNNVINAIYETLELEECNM